MPYVFVEELEDGQEAAEVVERAELDTAKERVSQLEIELDESSTRLEEAIDRAMKAEADLKASRKKYADAFLSKPIEVAGQSIEGRTLSKTFSELFVGGE